MDRQLLYSGPGGKPFDDGSKYNVVCTVGYTSRGIPSYLVSFCCPAQERHGCGPEIFTVQIRKGALSLTASSFLFGSADDSLSYLFRRIAFAVPCWHSSNSCRLLGEVTARRLALFRYVYVCLYDGRFLRKLTWTSYTVVDGAQRVTSFEYP